MLNYTPIRTGIIIIREFTLKDCEKYCIFFSVVMIYFIIIKDVSNFLSSDYKRLIK